ncbi:MAG TPA: tRNA (pseudouridine(54)-N(1))-methyltransferase TrmY [Candidatus Glassbacteria bacterium]|nr:tRNA (pseudouridine(54)-N(1))-methyltransferase TrmY [Candidatus Glassbacteria bacterium]
MSREFLLFSRIARTHGMFKNLHDAGRLDITYECIIASLFLSHGLRKNVIFHSILNGPPNPPIHLQIEGEHLYDVRTDVGTWELILTKVLSNKSHPGITVGKRSFESLLKTKADTKQIFVLEEGGQEIDSRDLPSDSLFVLGDHIGLPKKVENFALRYGKKISLGKTPYLASSCITVLNYLLDRKFKSSS